MSGGRRPRAAAEPQPGNLNADMSGHERPDGPEQAIAAAVDAAAAALLSIWERAQERAAAQLSGAQLRALLVIEQHDGINLRGLAAALNSSLSSASRLCDRLAGAGVLEREQGRLDRREIALRLTTTGRAMLADLRAMRWQQLAEVLSRMSLAGRAALLTGLQEFHAAADNVPAVNVPSQGAPAHELSTHTP